MCMEHFHVDVPYSLENILGTRHKTVYKDEVHTKHLNTLLRTQCRVFVKRRRNSLYGENER